MRITYELYGNVKKGWARRAEVPHDMLNNLELCELHEWFLSTAKE